SSTTCTPCPWSTVGRTCGVSSVTLSNWVVPAPTSTTTRISALFASAGASSVRLHGCQPAWRAHVTLSVRRNLLPRRHRTLTREAPPGDLGMRPERVDARGCLVGGCHRDRGRDGAEREVAIELHHRDVIAGE